MASFQFSNNIEKNNSLTKKQKGGDANRKVVIQQRIINNGINNYVRIMITSLVGLLGDKGRSLMDKIK